jgi:ABC-type uncharacterized transport system fused permease/ATPase subunit
MRTKSKMTDADLLKILEIVKLSYLEERFQGWTARENWKDVFSGGEKQRMAIGRLIYHRPKFAILDECTSAVSIDVEEHLYDYMKSIGITLITISHRETVWKYHDYILKFKEDKQFEFGKMPQEKMQPSKQ